MEADFSPEELYELEQSQLWEDAEFREYQEYQDFDPEEEVCFSDDSDDEIEEIDVVELEVPLKKGVKTKELTNASAEIGGTIHPGKKYVPNFAVKNLATKFNVNRSTISRIWARAKSQILTENIIDVRNQKRGRVGRKAKGFDLEILLAVPIEKRTTIKGLSLALGMSTGTVYRLLKTGQLRAHTNSIKPSLKHHHKIARLQYIMNQAIPGTVNTLPKFSDMYNVIHIDEKWFYMSQETQRFYLFPWEDDPYRACQSKRFISKVMFSSGVARPHISSDGIVLWDGKIGIFPFVEDVAAIRNSKNRDKGTIETKALQSITKEVIRSKMIEDLLPAIKSKWPSNACKDIWIQQDNARPHISPNDREFLEAATQDGFNIRLVNQPAQSPDMNILDLGFFRAIQSIQYKSFPDSVTSLIEAVENAYIALDPKAMNFTWMHLKYCMIEILQVQGGNNYKNPHKGKKKLERLGLLPTEIEVSEKLLEETTNYMNEGYIVNNVIQQNNIHHNVPTTT
ncbi:uncharacterized protein [Spinacia oleracea]|uniref:Mariner transposase n=1 Tax=Spinacia oleracea TaxID=3562 RepID=A0ABM3R7Z5_SPIOL|nr:uncharacterized protein LOC130467277 [Spinacia oleracea]